MTPADKNAKNLLIWLGGAAAVGLILIVAVVMQPAAPHYTITQTPLPRATSVADTLPSPAAATPDPKVRHPGYYPRNAPELTLPLNYLDIEKLFGKPTSTQSVGAIQLWYYSNVTYDPITDKIDRQVQVVIEDRLVTAINYY